MRLSILKSCIKLIATGLVCVGIGCFVPQAAWSQTETATNQAKRSAEGERKFNEGVKAFQQGQMAKAAHSFEQARAAFTVELDEGHQNTLSSMNNLAAAYLALGQHEKALALNEQTLKFMRAKLELGEDHPSMLNSMHNQALAYSSLDQYDKTLAMIPNIVSGVEKLRALPGLATEQQQSIFAETSDREYIEKSVLAVRCSPAKPSRAAAGNHCIAWLPHCRLRAASRSAI